MKGWLIFAGIFLVGVLLIVSAVVYYVLTGGAEETNLPARILALLGIILIFGAIYGSAIWRFRRWYRTRNDPPFAAGSGEALAQRDGSDQSKR